jgi:hypothetical protein
MSEAKSSQRLRGGHETGWEQQFVAHCCQRPDGLNVESCGEPAAAGASTMISGAAEAMGHWSAQMQSW